MGTEERIAGLDLERRDVLDRPDDRPDRTMEHQALFRALAADGRLHVAAHVTRAPRPSTATWSCATSSTLIHSSCAGVPYRRTGPRGVATSPWMASAIGVSPGAPVPAADRRRMG